MPLSKPLLGPARRLTAQQFRVFGANPEDLSSNPRTHTVDREKHLPQFYFHMEAMVDTHAHTCTLTHLGCVCTCVYVSSYPTNNPP